MSKTNLIHCRHVSRCVLHQVLHNVYVTSKSSFMEGCHAILTIESVTCYIYTDTEQTHPHQVIIRTYLIHCRHVRRCVLHQVLHDVYVTCLSSKVEGCHAILSIESVTCYIYTDTEQTHPHQVIIRTYLIHCRHVRRCVLHQVLHDVHVPSPSSKVEGSTVTLTIESVTCYIYTDTEQTHPHQVIIRTYLIHCRHVRRCVLHQVLHNVYVTCLSSKVEGCHAILTIESVTCYIYRDTEQTHPHQVIIRTYPIHCRHVSRCVLHQVLHNVYFTIHSGKVEGRPAILTIEIVTCYIYTDTEQVHPHQVIIRTYLIHCRHVSRCVLHQVLHNVYVTYHSSNVEGRPAILTIESVTCYIYTDTEQVHPHQVIIRTYLIHCRHVSRCVLHQVLHNVYVTSHSSKVEGSTGILTIESVTCYIYTDLEQTHPHQVIIRTYISHCCHVSRCVLHQVLHNVYMTCLSSKVEGSTVTLTIESVTCYIYTDTEHAHPHQVIIKTVRCHNRICRFIS